MYKRQPYDDSLGVHPQAEGFTSHAVWDFAATSAERYPLLLHFPYFDLYRKQVVKQADLVLAMHLRGEAFTDCLLYTSQGDPRSRQCCDMKAVTRVVLKIVEIHESCLAQVVVRQCELPDFGGDHRLTASRQR